MNYNKICKIDSNMNKYNSRFISQPQYRRREIYGLGVGINRKLKWSKTVSNYVYSYIWVKQQEYSPVHCSMDTKDFGIINAFIYELRQKHNIKEKIFINIWVHTHPNIGVFLSGEDMKNLSNWAVLNNELVAIVLDPFSQTKKHGAFTPDFNEIDSFFYESSLKKAFKNFFIELQRELPKKMESYNSPLEAVITPFGSYEKPVSINKKNTHSFFRFQKTMPHEKY